MSEKDIMDLKQENAKQNWILEWMGKQIDHIENSIESIRDWLKWWVEKISNSVHKIEKANSDQRRIFEEKKNCAINDLKDRSESKFASKIVEKIVFWLWAAIWLSIVWAFISLILK